METIIERLVACYEGGELSRRQLVAGVTTLVAALAGVLMLHPGAAAEQGGRGGGPQAATPEITQREFEPMSMLKVKQTEICRRSFPSRTSTPAGNPEDPLRLDVPERPDQLLREGLCIIFMYTPPTFSSCSI